MKNVIASFTGTHKELDPRLHRWVGRVLIIWYTSRTGLEDDSFLVEITTRSHNMFQRRLREAIIEHMGWPADKAFRVQDYSYNADRPQEHHGTHRIK